MYGKHFESMYTGSMYGAGATVFAVWGYIIATTKPGKDKDGEEQGYVEVNPDYLAGILGCKASEVEEVLGKLQNPDRRSRSEVEDGKKLIREGQFQFRVVNWSKYRAMLDEDRRRDYNRIKKQESRARQHKTGQESLDGQ